ncbi:hypothetical protein PG988_001295 [Apiospora saccharicola]
MQQGNLNRGLRGKATQTPYHLTKRVKQQVVPSSPGSGHVVEWTAVRVEWTAVRVEWTASGLQLT